MLVAMTLLPAAKSLQSCPTLCNPMDCSLPGSSIHGIFRATVLEWGAIAFSHDTECFKHISISALCALQQWAWEKMSQGSAWVPKTLETRESESRSVKSDSSQPHGLCSPWNSPGQNTTVGSHSLLQGVFPTQGSNPGLPHWRRILYHLSQRKAPEYWSA